MHFISDHDTYRCLLLIDILHKLLTHILIDEDRNIRLLIIKSLNIERFDKYLIQPEFLKVLFLLLNDESFAIQEETISVLGRLSYRNPGNVSSGYLFSKYISNLLRVYWTSYSVVINGLFTKAQTD